MTEFILDITPTFVQKLFSVNVCSSGKLTFGRIQLQPQSNTPEPSNQGTGQYGLGPKTLIQLAFPLATVPFTL